MSLIASVARSLIAVREELHELADKVEKAARKIDISVDSLLDMDTATSDHNSDDTVIVQDFRLERTSYACPEQYDAYFRDEPMPCAYFRLRNGHFTVQVPDVEGELVYSSSDMKGDGIFDSPEERLFYLTAGIEHVKSHMLRVLRKMGQFLTQRADDV